MRGARDAVYYAQCGLWCIRIGTALLACTGLYVIGVA